MNRRQFVISGATGVSTFAFTACGGGGEAGAAAPSLSTPSVVPGINSNAPLTAALSNRQYQSWDGGSGPGSTLWSQKLQLPWVHPGVGDWLDANQTPQGTLPFASATVNVGLVALDVTALVKRWQSTGENRGFYLRSGENWAFNFAGRDNAAPSVRPQLRVVTSSGVSTIACICNAAWSPSSTQARDSRTSFSVARGNWLAILQFDASTITEPVTSATLSLTCLSLKNPGLLEVFELDPPRFRDGGGAHTKQQGLASSYLFDRGLGSHPQVLFAGDFSDLSKKRWQTGSISTRSMQVVDPKSGSTYLSGVIPGGALSGSSIEHSVVNSDSSGIPTTTESALYGRYYVYLENDWGSEVDANKMPGWDGRFGWWNSVGYWQSTTGNGGARPTGLKVRNTTNNRWEYEGASMRGHGGTRANDGNPYDDLFWVGNYIYHLDQVGPFGEPIKWPGVVLGKGRWYCIEQYIKMNSITGPFDANGNGVAVNDGAYRVWVDGVLAYERANFRWRRHPEMGIQGFWLNWYHGGTAAAPRDMHFRMDAVVIARDYIGPRNEGA